jgi:hypothetical protein
LKKPDRTFGDLCRFRLIEKKFLMGQKTNPISLRLHIDRHFDSCWYPGHSSEYGHYLHTDLNIRDYLKSLYKTLGFHTGRIHVQFYPKKLAIHYFCHPDPLKTKRRRPQTLSHSPSSSFSFKGFEKSTLPDSLSQEIDFLISSIYEV